MSDSNSTATLRIPVSAEAFHNWLIAYICAHQSPIPTDAGRFDSFRATWPKNGIPIRAEVRATWYANDGSESRDCGLVALDVIPLGTDRAKVDVAPTLANGAQYARDLADEARRDWGGADAQDEEEVIVGPHPEIVARRSLVRKYAALTVKEIVVKLQEHGIVKSEETVKGDLEALKIHKRKPREGTNDT